MEGLKFGFDVEVLDDIGVLIGGCWEFLCCGVNIYGMGKKLFMREIRVVVELDWVFICEWFLGIGVGRGVRRYLLVGWGLKWVILMLELCCWDVNKLVVEDE